MSKYLSFEKNENVNPKRKTKIYDIVSIQTREILGQIRWFGAWRKYVFFPSYDTIWDQKCLTEIIEFINQLMKERK